MKKFWEFKLIEMIIQEKEKLQNDIAPLVYDFKKKTGIKNLLVNHEVISVDYAKNPIDQIKIDIYL